MMFKLLLISLLIATTVPASDALSNKELYEQLESILNEISNILENFLSEVGITVTTTSAPPGPTTTTASPTNPSESTSTSNTANPTPTVSSNTPESTTTVSSNTPESTPTVSSNTPESTTTVSSTTPESTTTVSSTTPESTTTVSSTTLESTTTVSSTTPESTTTVSSTTPESTTTVSSTTAESTTTVSSTTPENTTTPIPSTGPQTNKSPTGKLLIHKNENAINMVIRHRNLLFALRESGLCKADASEDARVVCENLDANIKSVNEHAKKVEDRTATEETLTEIEEDKDSLEEIQAEAKDIDGFADMVDTEEISKQIETVKETVVKASEAASDEVQNAKDQTTLTIVLSSVFGGLGLIALVGLGVFLYRKKYHGSSTDELPLKGRQNNAYRDDESDNEISNNPLTKGKSLRGSNAETDFYGDDNQRDWERNSREPKQFDRRNNDNWISRPGPSRGPSTTSERDNFNDRPDPMRNQTSRNEPPSFNPNRPESKYQRDFRGKYYSPRDQPPRNTGRDRREDNYMSDNENDRRSVYSQNQSNASFRPQQNVQPMRENNIIPRISRPQVSVYNDTPMSNRFGPENGNNPRGYPQRNPPRSGPPGGNRQSRSMSPPMNDDPYSINYRRGQIQKQPMY